MAYKTIYIPEGIPNIQSYFPGIDFSTVADWTVALKTINGDPIAQTRVNKIGCCCTADKVRIYFINSLGEIDSVNFSRPEESTEVKSESWEAPLRHPLNRTIGGNYRKDIRSNESISAENGCISEDNQYWIKELFETPKAWIEVNLPNGFSASNETEQIPIVITDKKIVTRKAAQRYEYIVKIDFYMSNANITLR